MTRHVVFLTVCTLRIRVLVEHKGDCEPSCIKDTPFFFVERRSQKCRYDVRYHKRKESCFI